MAWRWVTAWLAKVDRASPDQGRIGSSSSYRVEETCPGKSAGGGEDERSGVVDGFCSSGGLSLLFVLRTYSRVQVGRQCCGEGLHCVAAASTARCSCPMTAVDAVPVPIG